MQCSLVARTCSKAASRPARCSAQWPGRLGGRRHLRAQLAEDLRGSAAHSHSRGGWRARARAGRALSESGRAHARSRVCP